MNVQLRMGRTGSNKTSLTLLRRNLRAYRTMLPSLELKRYQLMLQMAEHRDRQEKIAQALESLCAAVGEAYPMLAAQPPADLLTLASVKLRDEALLGVRLPIVDEVCLPGRSYGLLATPSWVEVLMGDLREAVTLTLRYRAEADCVRRLQVALTRTIQRINLFEKALIPSTHRRIRQIEIMLQDGDRAAVVRSKIAKRRHLPSNRSGLVKP